MEMTEDGQNTVLLLEAGGDDQSPIGDKTHIPINCVPGRKQKQIGSITQNHKRMPVLQ